jgi:hypothetical protein
VNESESSCHLSCPGSYLCRLQVAFALSEPSINHLPHIKILATGGNYRRIWSHQLYHVATPRCSSRGPLINNVPELRKGANVSVETDCANRQRKYDQQSLVEIG